MELKLNNISYNYKGKNVVKNIDLTLNDGFVYGIIGEHKTLLLEIIDEVKKHGGTITLDDISNKQKLKYRKNVALVTQDDSFFTDKVNDEMIFILSNLKKDCKDYNKRMLDSLKLVGLNETYLNRRIDTLSETETLLFKISCNILSNPKVIIFDEVFKNLDKINRKVIFSLINKMKNNYGKIVIISSNDSNLLYANTDYMIVLSDGNIVSFDTTTDVFKNIDLLNKCNIDIPYLVDFSYKVRNKGIRLSYHKDILDLIKDVYKHV